MKKIRSFIVLACLALSLVGGSSHATVGGVATQYASLYAGGQRGDAYLYIRSTYGASSTGAATVVWEATAGTFRCDEICDGETYNWQRVDPTSLQMDPLANSVRIVTTLTNESNVQKSFDLTFTRPESLSPYACFPSIVCANAWVTPDGSAAGATAAMGLSRYGYVVSGTFASAPLMTAEYEWVDANAGTLIGSTAALP